MAKWAACSGQPVNEIDPVTFNAKTRMADHQQSQQCGKGSKHLSNPSSLSIFSFKICAFLIFLRELPA